VGFGSVSFDGAGTVEAGRLKWNPEQETTEIADTQMDTEEEDSGKEVTQRKSPSAGRERSRSPQRVDGIAEAADPEAKVIRKKSPPPRTVLVPELDPIEEAVNQGSCLHDQKGTGDWFPPHSCQYCLC
jgi:hypothetical protein